MSDRTARAAAVLALAAAGMAVAGCGPDSSAKAESDGGQTSAATTTPAAGAAGSEIAKVRGDRIGVYASPGATHQQKTLTNPNSYGAPRVLLVTKRSGTWLRVLLPIRPNGTQGWVRASDVTVGSTPYRVAIRLGALRFTVYDGDKPVRSGRIAVGTEDNPTPPGRYYFTELLRSPDPHGDYGPYAYGLSGHSPTLKRFGAGPGQLAVHGTDQPSLLGHRVSHGCIRIRNSDITWMARYLALGTPVTVTK